MAFIVMSERGSVKYRRFPSSVLPSRNKSIRAKLTDMIISAFSQVSYRKICAGQCVGFSIFM